MTLTELEFECIQCQHKCKIVITIELQGGVHAFKPCVGCVISPHLNEQAEWRLV